MARQGETAALDEQLCGLVYGVVVDVTGLVRQSALGAVREALGREEARRRAPRRSQLAGTRVVELVPATPTEPAPRVDDPQLRDAIVEHLATHPDQGTADPAVALDAEPRRGGGGSEARG